VSIFGELLFTPQCISCARLGKTLCLACLGSLKPFSTQRFSGISQTYCAGEYSGWLRETLITYKNGNASVAPALAQILLRTLETWLVNVPLQVIPIPSSRAKNHLRGYDSISRLCAEMLQQKKDLQVAQGALYLGREVRDQVGLDARQRQANLAGAFTARQRLSGTVVIVDDVTTTGATLTNAAKALRIAGAQSIFAIALCGSPDNR
jgi:ComF family protein